jgi:hypothetical protein
MTATVSTKPARVGRRNRLRLADALLAIGSAILLAASLMVATAIPATKGFPIEPPTIAKSHYAAYSIAERLELLK